MKNLFCYGTLQLPEVIADVIGRVPPSQPAELLSYVRYRVTGERYPAVVPRKDASTPGVLYFRLNPLELRRLDRFEGSEYCRQMENVVLADGSTLPACVYVWQMQHISRLSRQYWDLRQFMHSAGHAGFAANRLNHSR